MLLNDNLKNKKCIIEKQMLEVAVVYAGISTLEILYCRKCIKTFKEVTDFDIK